jgi:hypothetical protein
MSLLAFDKGSKGPSPSNPNDEAQSIRTPSPYQVVSDLIDATCHEILSLQGDEGTDSIPSVSSFTVLAQRLDYYLEQLSNTVPLLEDLNVSTRLLLAKLVLDVCVRSSYPPDDDDKIAEITSQQMYPLIAMTEEEWEGLRRELGMVHSNISSMESADSASLDSLICQVQALEALAKLRSQLQSAIAKIEEDEGKSPSKKNPPATFSFISGHLEQYKAKAEEINGKFETIDKNLFVPNEILSMKRCSTIQRVKASAESLVCNIDDMVSKKVFPLNYLQTSILTLLKKLEKDFLPTPTLYQVGYFNDGSSTPASSPAPRTKSKSSESTTPVSPSAASSYDGHKSRHETRKPKKKPNYADDISRDSEEEEALKKRKFTAGKTKKKEASGFDFESDFESDEEVEPQFKPVKKKKTKRVPYSEEEKCALLEGVAQFGKGEWRKIRDHYADIFDVNNRSTVNLKDLYRTLTK